MIGSVVYMFLLRLGLLQWLISKESACNAGDSGSIPGSGRSSEEGNGKLLQYFLLGNHMGRESLQTTNHYKRVRHILSTKQTANIGYR